MKIHTSEHLKFMSFWLMTGQIIIFPDRPKETPETIRDMIEDDALTIKCHSPELYTLFLNKGSKNGKRSKLLLYHEKGL